MGFTAVALSDDVDGVRRAAAALRLSMPVALAQGETLGPNGVRTVPAVLLVNAQGMVVDRITGRVERAELVARVARLVAKP